ncbi:ATPase domain-containing protein [Natronolimnohabitans sp. A-GB9]|uniref:RAD55 family ATPase n=1 Tax=Natronolimnohabitans sp. A-GB9 TaxID=3069757 RepID=UPI0027B54CCA|nr:ATPase domain-containing protein [Natronolimnohabitans sp. A-GB9]MDQ2050491.1 ATPase domain-containing protein [Natronolimnohabitans sp. A-GB9]
MSFQQRSSGAGEYPLECDYCQYPIPGDPVESDDGVFCSAACLEGDDGSPMPNPGAYKRIVTGVEPLDSLVPNGVPADAFVRLAGAAGTRRSELLTELVWRALERGEPAVVVTATTPPTAVLERFFENGWNVLPALEDDRLRLVDCFTHDLTDRETDRERHSEWIEFVGKAAAESIVTVDHPDDVDVIRARLTDALDALEMSETGLVTIDSLEVLARRLQGDRLHDTLLALRATICKARYVPIVAATTAEDGAVAVDDAAVFDGIVDLRIVDGLESETRQRQLGVRKLTGARHLPQWIAYEYEPARGLFALGSTTDPDRALDRGPVERNPRTIQ